jgi:hypothetical protein
MMVWQARYGREGKENKNKSRRKREKRGREEGVVVIRISSFLGYIHTL